MPYYDYRCRSCGGVFEIRRTMSEQASAATVACGTCGSDDTERVFTPIAVGVAGSAKEAAPASRACGPACACHPHGHA